jgi:hypothetical protein
MIIESASCGISLDVPTGWWARIWNHLPSQPERSVAPALHAGNFALPLEDGSFGFGATIPTMREANTFLALVEVAAPSAADEGIFEHQSLPDAMPLEDFTQSWLTNDSTHFLSRQYFCTLSERAFALFVAFGSRATLLETRADVLAMLRSVVVTSASEMYGV